MIAILVALPLLLQDPVVLTGTWKGTLVNHPLRPSAKSPDVRMEFGPMPTQNGECTMWRTSYFESAKLIQTKDYKLCSGSSADADWIIDEGGGVKLAARWLGGALVSPFKYDKLLLISTLRLKNTDELEEEILTIDDKPNEKEVLPLHPRGIQRISLRRVK
jgi:hypothetical protein